MVEHQLPKLRVASSNLVSRSKKNQISARDVARTSLVFLTCIVALLSSVLGGCIPARKNEASSPGSFTEYTLGNSIYGGAEIVRGGAQLWVNNAVSSGDLVRLDTNGNYALTWAPKEALTFIRGIAVASGNKIWLTVASGYLSGTHDRIVGIAQNGFVKEYRVPTYPAGVGGITIGSDKALWFTEHDANKIGRMTQQGKFSEFQIRPINKKRPILDSLVGLDAVTLGPDGAVWFTENRANKIGRISRTGMVREFPLGPASGPEYIVAGPDHALWFTEQADYIGRITPSGSIREFEVPTRGAGTWKITVGQDRNLWFTEVSANKIARITPSGRVTEFSTPGRGPAAITAGPDGNIWFTESKAEHTGLVGEWGAVCRFLTPRT